MSALAVQLGLAEFGLPAASVREVLRPPPVTRVPFPPPDVRGVAQVRGALVTVLDLGTRLRGMPAAATGRMVVVAGPAGEALGLLVDRVLGLVETAAEAPPAEAEVSLPAGWLAGVAEPTPGRRVALLDLERVLAGDDG
ncbi:MAG TPA: chemotaxis protein CheW [Longimicrobium sp.]|nr:chemotaxis protein CheW [Longimicrobium sp.]